MTYRDALNLAAILMTEAEIEDAKAQSHLLMEYVTKRNLGFYLMHSDEEMPPDPEERYLALVKKRCAHIPLQYLTGEQEFMGLSIHVNDQVLIPRQDTEVLAEEAIRTLHAAGDQPRVLDLCTGSGCIALSIKSFCPKAEVCGSDISGEALKTAEENAAFHAIEVEWIRSDLFSGIDGMFDLIVCNPPYIPTNTIRSLMPEVRDHEPGLALDGGEDGMDLLRRIIVDCKAFLNPGGYLLLEIGSDQGDAVTALMKKNGFEEVRLLQDLAGLDRVVSGRRSQDV